MPAAERAKAKELGLKTYFTGRPCKHGHVANRLTVNAACLECSFPSKKKWKIYRDNWVNKYPGVEQEVKYRHRYGVELSQIRKKPNNCELCGTAHKKIVFDHCHSTGAFRGWICDPCNIALGNVKDNPELLRKMADYLEEAERTSAVTKTAA